MNDSSIIYSDQAPEPMGAYPHAHRVGDLVFLSGIGSRIPGSNEIPIGIESQTEQVIGNLKAVLASCGCTLEDVIDVTAFLVDMEGDFEGYNKVYAQHFSGIQATRTTIAIRDLPTPIAVEFKVIAAVGKV